MKMQQSSPVRFLPRAVLRQGAPAEGGWVLWPGLSVALAMPVLVLTGLRPWRAPLVAAAATLLLALSIWPVPTLALPLLLLAGALGAFLCLARLAPEALHANACTRLVHRALWVLVPLLALRAATQGEATWATGDLAGSPWYLGSLAFVAVAATLSLRRWSGVGGARGVFLTLLLAVGFGAELVIQERLGVPVGGERLEIAQDLAYALVKPNDLGPGDPNLLVGPKPFSLLPWLEDFAFVDGRSRTVDEAIQVALRHDWGTVPLGALRARRSGRHRRRMLSQLNRTGSLDDYVGQQPPDCWVDHFVLSELLHALSDEQRERCIAAACAELQRPGATSSSVAAALFMLYLAPGGLPKEELGRAAQRVWQQEQRPSLPLAQALMHAGDRQGLRRLHLAYSFNRQHPGLPRVFTQDWSEPKYQLAAFEAIAGRNLGYPMRVLGYPWFLCTQWLGALLWVLVGWAAVFGDQNSPPILDGAASPEPAA